MTMAEMQEDVINHMSTFQASAYITSTNIHPPIQVYAQPQRQQVVKHTPPNMRPEQVTEPNPTSER